MASVLETIESLPLLGFSWLRSLTYQAERQMLGLAGAPGAPRSLVAPDAALLGRILHERDLLFRADVDNIMSGYYPVSVLQPESPATHFSRLPAIAWDGLMATMRRLRGETAVFHDQATELLEDVPAYYQRNFHHQTDGYLSERSAELYDHQVELLFAGAGDAMRRLAIRPLKTTLGTEDGRGASLLELGAGTGRATRSVRLGLPKARITAVDLSPPYLKVARRKLAACDRIDFVEADAADLPFERERFDAVYSVFMFHEMPLKVRQAVLAEARRVLKPDGVLVVVDSIQLGDVPEFDELLESFPVAFHEPFYANYVATPLDALLSGAEFEHVQTERGFLSKVAWGVARSAD